MKYTEELDKVSYCFGLSIASNLLSSGVNTINTEAFVDAIKTVYAGQMPEIKPEGKGCWRIGEVSVQAELDGKKAPRAIVRYKDQVLEITADKTLLKDGKQQKVAENLQPVGNYAF